MTNRPTFPPFPPWPEPAVTGLVDVTGDPLDFTPVPRLRKRRRPGPTGSRSSRRRNWCRASST